MKTLMDKLTEAMVGHSMEDIASALITALGAVLAEADPDVRDAVIEESCAEIARRACQPIVRPDEE